MDFTSAYFLRSAALAAERGCGVGLIHSHPQGHSWQRLNQVDHDAEALFAAQALALTDHPLLGMTFAGGDAGHSARIWQQHGARRYRPLHAENVRVVGEDFTITFNNLLLPAPTITGAQQRSLSAWGQQTQDTLARLHVGVVGTGSVGMLVVEALARTGVGRLSLFDFDTVQTVNLDRLLHATPRDARVKRPKVHLAAREARRAATAPAFQVSDLEASITEPDGFAVAADCDVLFSCVDRPWPRHVLNQLAYAHLIPVVDGGVSVDARGGRLQGAEWRAHIAAPGRACLECLGQYDSAYVPMERDGLLEDPSYITGLPTDHPLRRKENVFVFSTAAAAAELAQFITMVAAPAGVSDNGAHLYHLATGTLDRRTEGCNPGCPYDTTLLSLGDAAPTVTGRHLAAERARAGRNTLRAHFTRLARRWRAPSS
ncbi:ThiF family adenylyltransferase [Streptomyces sp. NBC_00201]|uniref:ThiF family adenylyltransferase n=1 Tax=unclassified Streptomyces TaxID=2593676 RepID=UPI002250FE2F|nr:MULTISPECIES: ThiF family adenylyltransferase [unclassified Streptomyces]MCX5250366.1 ThiF family adenylyltransferase [Streptomyces sp. NBC_00201]MCX5288958.1 ThiF family adenylyltransferase [Streptomyces sp. NBC_00183]